MILRRLRKAIALAWIELRYRGKPAMLATRRRSIGARYRVAVIRDGIRRIDAAHERLQRKRSQTAPTPGADE